MKCMGRPMGVGSQVRKLRRQQRHWDTSAESEGVIIQQRVERNPKGAVFGDTKSSMESKENNGKYSLALAIRSLLKTFKRTSKSMGNKSRNEEAGPHQSEMLLHRPREQSTQWKGDPWNWGKYLQIIYLMRGITFQNKYKALMQLNSKNQIIQSKNGQRT